MTTLIIMLQPECEGCRGENRRSQTVQGNKVTFSRYFNGFTCHILHIDLLLRNTPRRSDV